MASARSSSVKAVAEKHRCCCEKAVDLSMLRFDLDAHRRKFMVERVCKFVEKNMPKERANAGSRSIDGESLREGVACERVVV